MTTFPAAFPPNCPPSDAEDATGIFYRLVKNVPPLESDFLSWHELGKTDRGSPCERAGLSVFREMEDAQHYARAIPSIGKHVATATLSGSDGKIKNTPRHPNGQSHCTWWPYQNVDRKAAFKVR